MEANEVGGGSAEVKTRNPKVYSDQAVADSLTKSLERVNSLVETLRSRGYGITFSLDGEDLDLPGALGVRSVSKTVDLSKPNLPS
jgi:hypothetical protein